MPQFTCQYVGGPADGLRLIKKHPPQYGDMIIWTTPQGQHHAYSWRPFAAQPPEFRHDGIVQQPGRLAKGTP